MALRIVTALRTDLASDFNDKMNAGSGPGTIAVRTGPPPTLVGDADIGTLLATLTCSDPFGTVTNGVLTASAITSDTSAAANGTPGHLRFKDSDGTVVADCTAGVGSGDASFDQAVEQGGTVAISSLVITAPIS